MKQYRYFKPLNPGECRSVVIQDTNEWDGTFCAAASSHAYNHLDRLLNCSTMPGWKPLARFEPNWPCLVRYQDGKLYRATIVKPLVLEKSYFVYLVDFGCIWSTTTDNMLEIPHTLVDILVPVFRCKLALDCEANNQLVILEIVLFQELNVFLLLLLVCRLRFL